MKRVLSLGLALATLAGCGGKKQSLKPVLPASPPVSAVPAPRPAPPVPPPPPPSPLEDARRTEAEGRPADAVLLYEQIASTAGNGPDQRAARLAAARWRLSSDPAVRDLRKAQALLSAPDYTPADAVPLPVRDVLRLLDEAADLRGQLRTARAEAKALEAEVAKKDEALRRVTSAVVGSRPPRKSPQ